MTDADLIEMVCDWTTMAQEFGECNGSAREYADRTIGKRLGSSAEVVGELRQFFEDC